MSTTTPDAPRREPGLPHPAAEGERAEAARQSRRLPDPEPSEQSDREGRELLDAAARAGKGREKLTDGEKADALEWFLSDTPQDDEDASDTIELNVGTRRRPKWIEWEIQSVDRDLLRKIRRDSSQQSRRQRVMGQTDIDADRANLRIVVEGTIKPDLRAAAQQLGLVDPADAVKRRFARKPGLIDQIAGEIMSISGFDDEDVREVDAARG